MTTPRISLGPRPTPSVLRLPSSFLEEALRAPTNAISFATGRFLAEHFDGKYVLTIATTNHPFALDPALLDRPSRFDRKYHFALPRDPERSRYVEMWSAKLDPRMRLSKGTCRRIALDTEGFSYAYLKELFVSSMLRWMEGQAEGAMEGIIDAELAVLLAQRKTRGAVGEADPTVTSDV